jgi:hypothetical protein
MFTSANPTTVIDSISAAEGAFKIPKSGLPEIDMLMLYSNKGTGTTFGTCPMKTSRLSEKTIQAFRAFIESAETDFGSLILEGGFIAEVEGRVTPVGMAESAGGLQARGLGGV